MLATLSEPPLTGAGLVFEPKYDGIRGLVHVEPAKPRAKVRIWSRLGNEKTAQFPSIVNALATWGATLTGPVLLDGEIVALDPQGKPAGFQKLQGRIHLTGAQDVEQIDKAQPVALILFDILRDGDEDLRGHPLTVRRARLAALLGTVPPTGDSPPYRGQSLLPGTVPPTGDSPSTADSPSARGRPRCGSASRSPRTDASSLRAHNRKAGKDSLRRKRARPIRADGGVRRGGS